MSLNRTAFQNIIEAQERNPFATQVFGNRLCKSATDIFHSVLLNPLLIKTTKDRLTKKISSLTCLTCIGGKK